MAIGRKNPAKKVRPGRVSSSSVYELLKQKIQSQEFGNGMRLPPLYDLAEQLNVNYRTLKSALNQLQEEGLITYQRGSGAVVNCRFAMTYFRWEGDAFCVATSEGVRRFCVLHEDIDFQMVDVSKSHTQFLDAIASYSKPGAGLLIMPFELPEYTAAIQKAMSAGTRVVFVDRVLEGLEVSAVTSDHFAGAFQATNHLLEQHHRPVCYIGSVESPSSCRNWVKGWTQAMNAHNYFDLAPYTFGLEHSESELATSVAEAAEDVVKAALRLFKTRKEDIYSIFAGNDYTARSVYMAAELVGLTIGKDVFVVGFGDMPLCRNLPVPMTSVCQDPEAMGFEAAKLLYETLTGSISGATHRLIPVRLCVRDSSLSESSRGAGLAGRAD